MYKCLTWFNTGQFSFYTIRCIWNRVGRYQIKEFFLKETKRMTIDCSQLLIIDKMENDHKNKRTTAPKTATEKRERNDYDIHWLDRSSTHSHAVRLEAFASAHMRWIQSNPTLSSTGPECMLCVPEAGP